MRQVQKVLNDTTSADKPSTTVYPTFALSPETGVEIGFSALKLFRAKNDTLNRLSELQAFTFFTFNGQYGLWLDNAIYSDKDKWFFLGRTRIQKFPMFYYGIGPDASGDNHAVVDAFTVAIKQRVLRRVIKNVFAGPEIDFQNTSSVRFNQPEVNPFELPRGSTGSTNIGLGGALVYDNRHNVLNVRKGMFGEVSFLHYNPSLGSSFQYNSINVDLRSFYPVGKRNVLAWQVLGNFQSGEIPFNQLAMMGGDMMMRGYYQGRYRDKNMIAAQTEFRMLPFAFHKRLGGSVFASTAMVAPKVSSFTTNNLKFAGGFGLRYLLFPKKDIYLRLDIGFSKEGSSFYILNGEAF
ncbi:BamA/TamA family outer membrane protein [Pedobacter sp. MC2016-15]|uniref:BamA/TamA family outer membrane protein n=1 Tax=Pedobacter sp. MC2016-15 TaxID=2994473 RepID=UPI0022457464|nr:BamA/TamA family outer membrane protein [Pedobacter sp. MC2016-15]MCX2479755.1 BamA/TamA family outer membrane protein [Pedobacter sp. MC2016-15]